MSVQSVKAKMNNVSSRLNSTTNDINNLITILNAVNEENINTIFTPIKKFITTLDLTKNDILSLYTMTSTELHILFSEYNSELKRSVEGFETLKTELLDVEDWGLVLYDLFLIHVEYLLYAMRELGLSIELLKTPIPMLNELLKTIEMLKINTSKNNNKLIVKARV